MKKNNERGQSTVEFIFAFSFGVSLVFMVFNSALNYCTGYLVHYATFMASRVYMVSGNSGGTPSSPGGSMNGTTQSAINTYAKYRLDAFKVGVDKFQINELRPEGMTTNEYLTVGARTIFDMKIDAIGRIAGETSLEMVSESFLGHEPTRAQCASRTCFGITGGTACSNQNDITLYDNGC